MPDLVIKWRGVDYKIKEDGLFDLTDKLEEAVSLPRLIAYLGSGEPNFSALSRAVRVLLEYAGVADVPDLLTLRAMIASEALHRVKAANGGAAGGSTEGMDAIAAVVTLVMPPAGLVEADESDGKKSKPHSSNPSTKSRSSNGASRRATSGK